MRLSRVSKSIETSVTKIVPPVAMTSERSFYMLVSLGLFGTALYILSNTALLSEDKFLEAIVLIVSASLYLAMTYCPESQWPALHYTKWFIALPLIVFVFQRWLALVKLAPRVYTYWIVGLLAGLFASAGYLSLMNPKSRVLWSWIQWLAFAALLSLIILEIQKVDTSTGRKSALIVFFALWGLLAYFTAMRRLPAGLIGIWDIVVQAIFFLTLQYWL